MRFKDYFEMSGMPAMVSSDLPGYNAANDNPQLLPAIDIELPTVTKIAQIRYIDDKKNPIFVHLSDGTKLYIPYDAYRRINGEPMVGKTMTIVFRRRADDKNGNHSKVLSIHC